jgi:hypothetical protein
MEKIQIKIGLEDMYVYPIKFKIRWGAMCTMVAH